MDERRGRERSEWGMPAEAGNLKPPQTKSQTSAPSYLRMQEPKGYRDGRIALPFRAAERNTIPSSNQGEIQKSSRGDARAKGAAANGRDTAEFNWTRQLTQWVKSVMVHTIERPLRQYAPSHRVTLVINPVESGGNAR